ncbi:MAG: haloacid dehalogenase [Candidatus Methanosuratus sp.]|nr:haloacid dehalogenase [Candidatus Methanosuratincola sp.]
MKFEGIMEEIDRSLKAKDAKRENIILQSREIIRRAGSAVLSIHRGDYATAEEHLEAARAALDGARCACVDFPEFYYTGPLPQAFQEYAEARILLALIRDREVPKPAGLGIPPEPYLTGVADAAGELRRYALDSIRRDNIDEAWRALELMEEAYTILKAIDYPRAVVPNLRRKVDVMRRLVEETRGDVTLAHQGLMIRRGIEWASSERGGRKGA